MIAGALQKEVIERSDRYATRLIYDKSYKSKIYNIVPSG